MKVSKLALMCLVMLAVLAGCKSSRKATGEGGAEAKEGRALLEAVEEGALEFHTLSARLSADLKLQDGKELGSRVELKMVRDSMIQLSVQPFLGIEVFRLELTTDTVRLIDRMGKRYVAERYSGLLEQAPELRIGQLCEEVGYGENPRYFSHLFHQSFGCSPSEYRRMLRQ